MRSIILALVLLPSVALAQTTTIYDANGRSVGTSQTQNGITTYRDSMGRMTGAAERSRDGRIELRDAMGRSTGTATAPRQ